MSIILDREPDVKSPQDRARNKSADQSPVFIVGVHRSGTTLLRYMLNSSPHIFIPPESDFIPRFFGRHPTDELSQKRIASLLNIIFARYRLVKEWQDKPPRVETFLQRMEGRTPAAFLDTLYRSYAAQYGAVRWGDKTPIYTSYLDLIHQIFPRAQFVHIIRDGRDVALSMLDKWGKREIHVDIYFAARNWVRRIRQAQTSGARLSSDSYYELRYEALVEDPEAELRPLCEFLGEPFFPVMAKPHLLGRANLQEGDFHAPLRQPPSTGRIGRWKQEMSWADRRLFQDVAGELLAELGYEVEDVEKAPLQEQARVWLLATKYTTLQAGRSVLQALGILPPI
jgi:hypothetical protein